MVTRRIMFSALLTLTLLSVPVALGGSSSTPEHKCSGGCCQRIEQMIDESKQRQAAIKAAIQQVQGDQERERSSRIGSGGRASPAIDLAK